MASIKALHGQGILCDVTVVAGGKQFDAHKLVLASGSDFFRERFAVARPPAPGAAVAKEVVTLPFDLQRPDVFPLVLGSIYTGRIKLTRCMLPAALRLSSLLGIQPLRRRLIRQASETATLANVEDLQALGAELKSQELLDAAATLVSSKGSLRGPRDGEPSGPVTAAAVLDSLKLVPEARCHSPTPSLSSAGVHCCFLSPFSRCALFSVHMPDTDAESAARR